jgi:thiazole synthase
MKPLVIAGKEIKNRLFLGTGKFSSPEVLSAVIQECGIELVTVALRRVRLDNAANDDILSAIDTKKVKIMLNTSGARDAREALKIASFGMAAGYDWIKLEIHPDPYYLLPDPVETLSAAETLVKEGFTVLPYINADPVLAKRLEDVGVAAVMPLGAPIGTNRGLETAPMLKIIIERSNLPVVVDAGLGLPSHAAAALEMGASAVLVNTAIASAGDPVKMARAFSLSIEAAVLALESDPPSRLGRGAAPTSPADIFAPALESQTLE